MLYFEPDLEVAGHAASLKRLSSGRSGCRRDAYNFKDTSTYKVRMGHLTDIGEGGVQVVNPAVDFGGARGWKRLRYLCLFRAKMGINRKILGYGRARPASSTVHYPSLAICFGYSLVSAKVPGMGGRSNKRCLSASRRVAAPTLKLAPHVIQPSAQPFDGPRDVSDIVASDGTFLINGHGWQTGFASRIGAVWRAIPLVAKTEGIPEPEVNASAIRVPPDRGRFLGEGRGKAENAADEDRGSHHHSMAGGSRPVECSNELA